MTPIQPVPVGQECAFGPVRETRSPGLTFSPESRLLAGASDRRLHQLFPGELDGCRVRPGVDGGNERTGQSRTRARVAPGLPTGVRVQRVGRTAGGRSTPA